MNRAVLFTGDELADVFVKRWLVRELVNQLIIHLQPKTFLVHGQELPRWNRNVPFSVKIQPWQSTA